ncbi:JmjC domain-containing protein [Coralloluteibacterium thermophilus]|uniref:JmjC domain-containing protein n=1 Tax=Coralloluteibacterium thermophilum TaxID=2707049 RepID=A0ABV9NND4_9GAMM
MARLPIEIDARDLPPLGMAPERFLRDYWQKRPLLIRNAFPGFVSPIAPEDLAGLACEDGVLARLVSHDRRRDHYALRTGPFDEAEFPGMPHRDWTLLVQDVDKWDADVRALLDAFAFLPRWRLDDIMVSFAAPGGSVGAHIDQYDVFLLQAHGHRRWQIDARRDPPTDFRDDVEIKLLRSFDPSHEWVLAPGDMLYLPPGVPHHGVAEDACLTFSVGMRAPAVAELMVDLVERLAETIPEERRYADPDLAPPADPFEIDDAALARVERALAALRELPQAEVRDWFGGFMTTYRSAGDIAPPPRAPTAAAIARGLERGGSLVRHPHARYAWARAGRGAVLYAHGERFAMATRSARLLCANEELDADAVAGLDARGRAALETLTGRGHYALRGAGRRRG